MMWTVIQWTQVLTGVRFAILSGPWRFLPHGVGQCFFLFASDFLADSELKFEIANTLHGAIATPICATFADYVSALPVWEHDVIAHATGDYLFFIAA